VDEGRYRSRERQRGEKPDTHRNAGTRKAGREQKASADPAEQKEQNKDLISC
jgi:hypothetical protein